MNYLVVLLGAAGNVILLLAPCALCGLPSSGQVVFVAGFLLLATLFYVGDSLASCHCGREPVRREREQVHERLALLTGVVLLLAFWCSLSEDLLCRRDGLQWLRLAGLSILAGGVALRLLAIWQLGPQFRTETTVRRERRLVCCGIYRYLRHPSESGLLLIVLGTAVTFASAIGLGLSAVMLVIVLKRLQLEERGLRAVFAVEYEAYCGRTPAIVPRATIGERGTLVPR